MKNGKIVDEYGTIKWYKNDVVHRERGPAVEYTDGEKYWIVNGKFHREDGPAFVETTGFKEWYLDHHREAKFNVFLVALSKSLNLSEFYK